LYLLAASACDRGCAEERPSDDAQDRRAARGIGAARVGQLVAGDRFTCALLDDGEVACWGGPLGELPGRVAGLTGAQAIAAGDHHLCALHRSGTVSCLGENADGQLGRKPRRGEQTLAPVAGVERATALIAGGNDTCVRGGERGLTCWGRSYATDAEPERRARLLVDRDVLTAALSDYDNVYRLGSGNVIWWGLPESFESHDGRYHASPQAPARVDVPAPARGVCASRFHSCAIAAAGSVHCWGRPGIASQRLGFTWPHEHWPDERGKISAIPRPPEVKGVADAVEIGCGTEHACARLASGAVACWGSDTLQGTAITDTGWDRMAAHRVDGVRDATHLAVGGRHACAALASGAIRCWGDGDLGSRQPGNGLAPVTVERAE
jgi:alpha-tubulin suppressor-like RCC1 family protein